MKFSQKIRVAILYGGWSAEHEISLQSASCVIKNLDRSRFEVIPVGIDKQGNWRLGEDVFLKSLEYKSVLPLTASELVWFTSKWVFTPTQYLEQKNIKVKDKKIFDVIFPMMHGNFCEDGALQGLLTLSDIPYVGCGVLASAIGMDKDVAKRLAKRANVNVLPYFVLHQNTWHRFIAKIMQQIKEQWNYPVFVKPANSGSSIGVRKVKEAEQLLSAIQYAFQFDKKVLVESSADMIELTVAMLESLQTGSDPIVSVVGEIQPKDEFYSYEAKYVCPNDTKLIIPTECSLSIQNNAQKIARKIFLNLECESMARIDLFFNFKNKKFYFNEVNTIPGFTVNSLYPKLLAASGIDYQNLLTHLIELALKKHAANRHFMYPNPIGVDPI